MRRWRALHYQSLDIEAMMPLHRFQPGDVLVRRLGAGPLVHYGLYVGVPDLPGVIHANKAHGVHFACVEEFAAGRRPEIVDRADGGLDAALRVARAQSRIGTPYDALTANCEHHVTYAQNGKAVSWQVRIIVAAVVLLLFAVLGRALAARR